MPELNCPSCGAKLEFKSSIALLAVCQYCKSMVMRDDLKLEDLGKVAQLQVDGSVVQLGARGEYRKVSFSVLGRVQMRYAQGFWNEWFLAFDDGRQGWLGEAQGNFAVSFRAESKAKLPPHTALKVGQFLEVDGEAYEIQDVRTADYISAEGELPFRPPLGQSAPVADLTASGGRFATIDYSEDEPILFKGEYQAFDALRFAGLKEVEGW